MQFINPALLWGLLAASIPIIIHLLHRRRFRVVRWAAMEFLLQARQENQRRLRLEHLLVLLLRCLALALLALTVARPLTSSAGLALLPGAIDPVERVVLLDDSGSMAHRAGQTSSFERAKQALAGLVSDLRESRPRDFLTVLRGSRPGPDVPRATPIAERVERLLRELPDLLPSERTFDAPAGLERALSAEGYEQGSRRVVYVLTDLRRRDWMGDAGELPARIAQVTRGAPEGTRVVVVDVGDEERRNLGVVELRPAEHLAQAGVPVELLVRVKNYGAEAVSDIPLSLEAGEARLPLAPIPVIPPGEAVLVRQRTTFPQPGSAALRVLLPEDALAMDDARSLALDVLDELRVLLVDGEPSPGPLQGETDMLRLALAPSGDERWGVEPVVISDAQLSDQALEQHPCLLLCNVGRWPAERVEELERFVRRGGGLALFLGDRVDPQAYEQDLYREGRGLLPCRLGQRVSFEDERAWPRLAPPLEDHPLTEILAGENNPFLRRVRVRAHMTLPLDPERDAGARVLLRLDDAARTPFAVEKAFGEGRVVLLNTTADRAWSTWPREASFPVVMLRLVRRLAPSSGAGRNLACGEPLVRALDPARLQPVVSLRLPGEPTPRELHAELGEGDQLALRYPDTDHAGIYELGLTTQAGERLVEHYAVDVDPSEGDLLRVDAERLRAALGPEVPLEVVRPAPGQGLLELTDGEQSELWRSCLLLVVVCLLAEQVLAWRAAHHRRAAADPASGDLTRPPWRVQP